MIDDVQLMPSYRTHMVQDPIIYLIAKIKQIFQKNQKKIEIKSLHYFTNLLLFRYRNIRNSVLLKMLLVIKPPTIL